MEKTNHSEKSMKSKTGFYIKINKVNTFLVSLSNNNKKKTHISNIWNGKGAMTTAPVIITMIMRGYSESLYANNFNTLNEINWLLERHQLPTLTQGEIVTWICLYLLRKLNALLKPSNKWKSRPIWLHWQIPPNI